jgi:two-component system sensor histidine kinase BaeS
MFQFKSLRTRLLAVFCLFSATLIGLFLVFNLFSFYQGLLEYVKQRDRAVVAKVAELMTNRVSRKEIILQQIHPDDWHDTVRDSLLSVVDDDERLSFSDRRRDRRRPPPSGIAKQLALVDLDKVPVFGKIWPSDDVVYVPVLNKGKTTAYIAFKPSQSRFAKQEENFIKQQVIGFILISCFALAICFLVAWWLANRISHPVLSVANGARKLSKGQFGFQVELTGHETRLQDEIGQLVKDFNYLSTVLERNEESRLNWSSDIAHELRTPVAVLKGEIEAITDGIRPASLESVASLKEEVDLLEKMIEDLRQLTLSDAGALDYHMESLELSSLVQQSVMAMQPLFDKADLNLKFVMSGAPYTLLGDSTRLKQLFNNLLTNSLKYTDAPSDVVVAYQHQKHILNITIEDGSPGVPSESLTRIFDRLYRVDKSRSRSTGGSGLGLAICKNIIEAHGASVHCDHSSLGGLKIQIRFTK